MKPVQRISLVAIVLVGALVAWLATRNRQPPVLPTDDEHRSFVNAATCDVCHGPDAGLPRSKNHPIGRECMRCHGLAK